MSLYDYSDELKEIIGKPPNRFVRYGSFLVLIVLLLLIAVSLIVSFPEEQVGSCIIYRDPLPKIINIQENGVLEDVFVKDGDTVGKNFVIGIIRSTAKLERIKALDSMVESWIMYIGKSEFTLIKIPQKFNGIGDLQAVYENTYWNYLQLRSYTTDPFFKYLKVDAGSESERSVYYKPEFGIPDVSFKEYKRNVYNILLSFVQSVQELEKAIRQWKNKYVISAPSDGKVYFSSVVFRNVEVHAGKPLIYVLPLAKKYYAQVILKQEVYSTIKIGQSVNISLPGFSNNNLKGHITSVSPIINQDGTFIVKIQLSRDMLLQIDNNIDLRNELHGTASIITGKKQLFMKMISNKNN